MRYNLADLARRQRNVRRSRIVLRDMPPPATLVSDLYAACYRPVVLIWERRLPAIVSAYERTLVAITTDSPADVAREVEEGASELSRILLELTAALDRWAFRVEAWQRGKWRGAILSATGVDVSTLIGPADVRETLGAVVQRNVALIKDVSAQAQGRISDAVFRGLNERRTARDVARELRGFVDMGRGRATRIAADQLTKITSSLADERRREAGITTWRWRHSGKKHPRANHVARDGKVYADSAAQARGDVLPPPDDRPGQLPFCGCRSQSVISFD